ncbi:MAG: M23 family metallopeptidase [Dehalococcoidia bacterium]|jgi:murein DD-endopeptidase MepM/ murein hydrolase activator NlpD|nr:MAG: Murein DD-endopeptidase MepM and murein hydrolase activator NlpD, containing LysM domain [Chloroflexota bacterium]
MKNFFFLFCFLGLFLQSCSFFTQNNEIIINIEKNITDVKENINQNIIKDDLETKNSNLVADYPSNFMIPIQGACITKNTGLLPGSPRPYRNGTHEGIDFYNNIACVKIAAGTEVVSVDEGIVIRVDLEYSAMTQDLLDLLSNETSFQFNEAQKLDIYRGRQIWIEHKLGIITRYAHLSAIANDVKLGTQLKKGTVIGYVGESGTPESVTDPGTENHLHFEIRKGSKYLGEGKQLDSMYELYSNFFAPQ